MKEQIYDYLKENQSFFIALGVTLIIACLIIFIIVYIRKSKNATLKETIEEVKQEKAELEAKMKTLEESIGKINEILDKVNERQDQSENNAQDTLKTLYNISSALPNAKVLEISQQLKEKIENGNQE